MSVKFVHDGVIGSIKEDLINISVKILDVELDILRIHCELAKVEQFLEHMNELEVFILKHILYVI